MFCFPLKVSVKRKKSSSLFVMGPPIFSEALGFSLLSLYVSPALCLQPIFSLSTCDICPIYVGFRPQLELDRFLAEFKFEFKRYLQVRVLRILFFEFKFEFDKNDRVQRVRVCCPEPFRSQWQEQINDIQLFFW